MFWWSAEYFTLLLSRHRHITLVERLKSHTATSEALKSVIGNGQNSKLLPLKSFVQNMQWLVKSVSSSFSKDLSHEAKARTRLSRPRPRTSKLSSRIPEDLSSRTPTLLKCHPTESAVQGDCSPCVCYCLKWVIFTFELHKIQFWQRFRPRPYWRS